MTVPARHTPDHNRLHGRRARRRALAGAIALCLAAGPVSNALAGSAAAQPAQTCTGSIHALYGWRGEIGVGRVTLTSAHVADFATLSPAPGIDAWGGFDLTLVADRGLDEIRIAPPELAFGGVRVSPAQWNEIALAIVIGDHVIEIDGPPDYAVTGSLTALFRTDRARPVDTVFLHLSYQDRHLVTGRVNAARLEAGLNEWDRQREAARAAGCLPT